MEEEMFEGVCVCSSAGRVHLALSTDECVRITPLSAVCTQVSLPLIDADAWKRFLWRNNKSS